jgi:hypothetical protein
MSAPLRVTRITFAAERVAAALTVFETVADGALLAAPPSIEVFEAPVFRC